MKVPKTSLFSLSSSLCLRGPVGPLGQQTPEENSGPRSPHPRVKREDGEPRVEINHGGRGRRVGHPVEGL